MPRAPRTAAPLLGEPVAVELMNTIWADRDGIHDALATPADVRGWLRAAPPIPELAVDARGGRPATASDRDIEDAACRLRDLRDAVRRLAAVQTADPRERAASSVTDLQQALWTVNTAAASAPHWSHLTWHPDSDATREVRTETGFGNAVVGALAEQSIELFATPIRGALRACLAPGCVLYFVQQHPRREWCSGACGNRARAARHYARHRAARKAQPGGREQSAETDQRW